MAPETEFGKARNMKPSLYSLTSLDWKAIFESMGHGSSLPYWLDGIRGKKEVWRRNLSPDLLRRLRETYSMDLPEISKIQEASDGTVKFQVRFSDSLEVETVLIPFHKRYTICLSTQVGCAMNCSFCYTGTQGLKRHLKAHEITGQYLLAFEWLKENNRSQVMPNIVFMGQGEPLHNVDEVCQAIKVLNDPKIIGVGHRQMTLSTVGHLPGLSKIKMFPKINLALSLHSPFPEQRKKLIPTETNFPLSDVLNSLDQIPLLKRQFITYEYVLMRNFNMSEDHANALRELLGHRKAVVNLIPFNPFPGADWERPSADEIEEFKNALVARKLRVMVRTTKGDDILAACGQLKIQTMVKKNERNPAGL